MELTPRPYLIRALYEWIVDNNYTPYITVAALQPDVMVPVQFIEDDKIILNIAMNAVQNLLLQNDAISFQARFSGVVHNIYVPIDAVLAIYAKENGEGMVFAEDSSMPPVPPTDAAAAGDTAAAGDNTKGGGKGKKGKRSHLRVVK